MSVLQSQDVVGGELAGLVSAKTVKEFKKRAKEILLEDPRLINQVIDIAQREIRRLEGGSKLILVLRNLRENLHYAKNRAEQDRYICRALRRAHATTESLESNR